MEKINVENFQSFKEIQAFAEENQLQVCNLPSDRLEVVSNVELDFGTEERFTVQLGNFKPEEKEQFTNWIRQKTMKEEYNPLIFGNMPNKNIVSCEIEDGKVELFIEENGEVYSEFIENQYWILGAAKYDQGFKKLDGNLWFSYIKFYNNKSDWWSDKKRYQKQSLYYMNDDKEAAMVYHGFTYYKGMKVNDVSVLAFDIETNGLTLNNDSKVYLIANTLRKNGITTRKMFSIDEYNNEAAMLVAWCDWVREVNPSLLIGHNIYMFDIPYLDHVAGLNGITLQLGRDDSPLKILKYDSKFRKDGSQDYIYRRSYVYGREIVDTMFVAYHYDFSRKYENYSLKGIIKHEGLEAKDRQFYDASKIRDNWDNLEERKKIKSYAEFDGDDALALFDLMIPAYFYLNPSIPKSFQAINFSASGSQINSFLVRSYLQDGHSVPQPTEMKYFEGAISFGNPGCYKNVFKVDVASLYPSVMLSEKVFDKYKDPKQHFLKMVEYFTEERLVNKKKGKETGDRYYKDLDAAQKIVINSAYGCLGTPGLNFNSPMNAGLVTKKGREILQSAIDWSSQYDFKIVNADTDSISLCFEDGSEMSEEVRAEILNEVNSLNGDQIRWEDDGYFPALVVVKAKNYILWDGKKLKIKGSGLVATMKSIALKQFINEVIDALVFDKHDTITELYHKYVREIFNITDITRWTTRKTVTEAVLNPDRTTEQKILNAIGGNKVQMGDKIRVYFTTDGSLKLEENWSNDHDPNKLVASLYDSLCVFENVLEIEKFTKFHLKSHKYKCELNKVLGLPEPEKVKKPRKTKE